MLRSVVAFVAELAGSAAVTVGAFQANTAAGWVTGGVFALWWARGLSR